MMTKGDVDGNGDVISRFGGWLFITQAGGKQNGERVGVGCKIKQETGDAAENFRVC